MSTRLFEVRIQKAVAGSGGANEVGAAEAEIDFARSIVIVSVKIAPSVAHSGERVLVVGGSEARSTRPEGVIVQTIRDLENGLASAEIVT